jgi:hypothetical protein
VPIAGLDDSTSVSMVHRTRYKYSSVFNSAASSSVSCFVPSTLYSEYLYSIVYSTLVLVCKYKIYSYMNNMSSMYPLAPFRRKSLFSDFICQKQHYNESLLTRGTAYQHVSSPMYHTPGLAFQTVAKEDK